MLFEDPAASAATLREIVATCAHITGKPIQLCTSATETMPDARQFAADLLRPEGMPHLWMVQIEPEPGEWRTLLTTGNAQHAEATARFFAVAATLLPDILPNLLALAETQAKRDAQQDELSMEAICYDI